MLKIGITGGIGSGKSVVCQIFKSMGIPIYDADAVAKDLVNNDVSIKNAIIELLGSQSFSMDGNYNREFVASIVFNDKNKLAALNAIVHPKVINYFPVWAENFPEKRYVIKEAAILFESGSNLLNNYNVLVYSTLEKRIERVMKRDQKTEEQVRLRISTQNSDEEKMKLVDHIIYNDDSHSLIEQVMILHNLFSN